MSETEPTSQSAEMPTQISIGPIAPPAAPRQRDPSKRSGSADWLEARAPRLIAIAGSAPALLLPFAWLVVCMLAALVLAAARRTRAGDGQKGPADWLVAPLRAVGAALTLESAVSAVVGIVVACCAALAIGAAIGAVLWLPSNGTDGVLAAMRLSVVATAPRLLAALLCYGLLHRQLRAPEAAAQLRARTGAVDESVLTAVAAGGCGVVVLCLLLGSSSPWPASSSASLVGLLPNALEQQVFDGEASLAESEARAVSSCLSDVHSAWNWQVGHAVQMADGSFRLTVRNFDAPGRRGILAAALSLQNQLLPYVSHVRLETPHMVVRVDRSLLPSGTLVTDPDDMAQAAGLNPGAFGPRPGVHGIVLDCSGAAV